MSQTVEQGGPGRAWANSAQALTADVQRIDGAARPRLMDPSVPEADAPTVLRVVSDFDELAERCADVAELVRSVALWTDCAAGVSGPGGRVLAHCDRHGARLVGGEPGGSVSREARSDGNLIARVWIERAGSLRPLDELVLARGARAAPMIIGRMTQVAVEVSPIPHLVELLIDADVSAIGRSNACRQLALEPNQSIRVAVVQAPGRVAGELGRIGRRIQPSGFGLPRIALRGSEAVLVMHGSVDADELIVPGMSSRWGIGPARPAIEAPHSYRRAREALRFALGPGAPPVADFDQLGSVVALAGVAETDLMDFPDWVALIRLSRTQAGLTAIVTAEVLMRTGSQRDAAVQMNLHHSTVAYRVSHVEQALGYGLGEHSNWFRAQLAIHLWRLTLPNPPIKTASARWRRTTTELPASAG